MGLGITWETVCNSKSVKGCRVLDAGGKKHR